MPTLTQDQLNNLLSDNHRSKVYLSIFKPTIVAQGVISGSFDRGARSINVSVTSGTLSNVESGMTMIVGSDRIRVKSVNGTTVNVAENSIKWANGVSFKILRNWELWSVFPFVEADNDNLTVKQDYDIDYVDQNEKPDPVPVMGSAVARKLVNGSTQIYFDGSDSFTIDGSPIVSYLWEFEGGNPSMSTDATPGYVTWNTAGSYWTSLTVTNSHGKSFTGRRQIIIHDDNDPPITKFEISSLRGAWDTNGWEAEIAIHEAVPKGTFYDRCFIVLWREDWFNGNKVEYGLVTDREEILFTGWVDGESISRTPYNNVIRFRARGAVPFMEGLSSFPVTLEYNSNPSSWWEMPDLTVDKAVWFYLRWHTTALTLCDFHKSGDARLSKYIDFEEGSVAQSINQLTDTRGIFARLGSDQYGRMHLEVNAQMHTGTITNVMTLDDRFWRDEEIYVRSVRTPTSWVELSGVYFNGNDPEPMISKAPGDAPLYEGRPETVSGLIMYDQQGSNQLAGNYLAWKNTEFSEIQLPLAGNFAGIFSPVPQEQITVNLNGTETYRGYVLTNEPFIVRGVEHTYNYNAGTILTNITVEQRGNPIPGVTGDYPKEVPTPPPPLPPPPPPPPPPKPPTTGGWRDNIWVLTTNKLYYVTGRLEGPPSTAQPTVYPADGNLSGIRAFVVDPFDPEGYQFCHLATSPEIYYRSAYLEPDLEPWQRTWYPLNVGSTLAAMGYTFSPEVPFCDLQMDVNNEGWLAFMLRSNFVGGGNIELYLVQINLTKLASGEIAQPDPSAFTIDTIIRGNSSLRNVNIHMGAFEPTKSGTWGGRVFNKLFFKYAQLVLGSFRATRLFISDYSTNIFTMSDDIAGLDPYKSKGITDPNDIDHVVLLPYQNTEELPAEYRILSATHAEKIRDWPYRVANLIAESGISPHEEMAQAFKWKVFMGYDPRPGVNAQRICYWDIDNFFIRSTNGGQTWERIEPKKAIGKNLQHAFQEQEWAVTAVHDSPNLLYAFKQGTGENYENGDISSGPPRDNVFCISDDGENWYDRSGVTDINSGTERMSGQVICVVPVWTTPGHE